MAVWQSGKSAASDKMDLKERPVTKITQKSCFVAEKRGSIKGSIGS